MTTEEGAQVKRVPVRMMLPLDTFVRDAATGAPRLKDEAWLDRALGALKRSGVDGVSVDVWWGLCALDGTRYDFGCVAQLAELCARHALHLTCIMSFHVCGNSVGDDVHVPLPAFVAAAVDAAGDAATTGFYCADAAGRVARDAFSPAADALPLRLAPAAPATTLLALYTTFMELFAAAMREEGLLGAGRVVDEVAVGLGPCGELRYPSYDAALGWAWPQAGVPVCHDAHMRRLARDAGVTQLPAHAEDAAAADARFLAFYGGVLADHAARVLAAARERAFPRACGVRLSVKFAGVHWLHTARTRPAEVCAGYGDYALLLRAVAAHGAGATFTCYDMATADLAARRPDAQSDPDALVREFAAAAHGAGVAFLAAENSLEAWDARTLATVHDNVAATGADMLTFLRLTPAVFPPRRPWRRAVLVLVLVLVLAAALVVAFVAQRHNDTRIAGVAAAVAAVVFTVIAVQAIRRRGRSADGLSETFVRFVRNMPALPQK